MMPLGRLLEDRIEQSAQVVSLFANGTRLEILYLLAEGDCSVGELASGTGSSFSAISQQLKLLTLGGLIERRRDGRNIHYRLRDSHKRNILALIRDFCPEREAQVPDLEQT